MDPTDNHGKAKQTLKEFSRGRRWPSINKGTANLVATNKYKSMRTQSSDFQHQHFGTTSSLSPATDMQVVQQNQRPLSVGNTNLVSNMTAPPASSNMQDMHNYSEDEDKSNSDVGGYTNSLLQLCKNRESRHDHLERPLMNTGGGRSLLQPKDIGVKSQHAVSSQNGNFVARNSQSKPTCVYKNSLTSKFGFCCKDRQDYGSILGKRSIGRFMLGNRIDLGANASPSIGSTMDILQRGGEVPDELKELLSKKKEHEIRNYVRSVRRSWPHTGCSIQLDGWTDHLGRSLINVVVDSPAGHIYLRSADVSLSTKGPNALQVLLEEVIEEVGAQNVIQIVSHIYSSSADEVIKQLAKKYSSVSWTVSATHCISHILDEFAMIDSIKQTIAMVKLITKFIYSRAPLLELLRKYISCRDLVIPSNINSVASFLTLQNFLLERRNLMLMVTSPEWLSSSRPWKTKGRLVAQKLIGAAFFWDRVIFAVEASIPVVSALAWISRGGLPLMDFIYEMKDKVKERIRVKFERKEDLYIPFWKMIDEIWNTIFHSPLHAAGHFLNPRLHFAKGFCPNDEVIKGLCITIARMAGDQCTEDLIYQQLHVYKLCEGDFRIGTDNNRQDKLPPVVWWSLFGGHCPDLQKLAIRILSQTCNGAEVYGLRRDLAEKLLSSEGMSVVKHERLRYFTYLYYNHKLKQSKMGMRFNIAKNEINLSEEWTVDETYQADGDQSGNTSLMNSLAEVGSSSGVAIKIEPDSAV